MNDSKSSNHKIFRVRDCTLITRMGGVDSAVNLREIRERVAMCPVESLYHHFCETLIRPSFDDPEFRNDFAVWASRYLRDRVIAERLGNLNPYHFDSLEELRARTVDIIDERLSEVSYIPWVPMKEAFRFMRAVTIIFDTSIVLHTPAELIKQIPKMSYSSIYFHFLEARRRTPDKKDDFTTWLQGLDEQPIDLIQQFAGIDFYCYTLSQLKDALIHIVEHISD